MLFVAASLLAWGLWFKLLSHVCFQTLWAYLAVWGGFLRWVGLAPVVDALAALKQAWADRAGPGAQHVRQQEQEQEVQWRHNPAWLHQHPHAPSPTHDGSCAATPRQALLHAAAHCWDGHCREEDHALPHFAEPSHHLHSPPSSACPSTASLAAEPTPADASSCGFSSSTANSSLRASCSSSAGSGSSGGAAAAPASLGLGCCAAGAAAAATYAVLSSTALSKQGAAAVVAAAVYASARLSEGGASSAHLQSRCSWVLPPVDFDASEEQQAALMDAAPPEFLCPLGRVLMTDPVFTPSGFTYHRPCIARFIADTGRDPARATPLDPAQLCPNINLRDSLVSWLKAQGIRT